MRRQIQHLKCVKGAHGGTAEMLQLLLNGFPVAAKKQEYGAEHTAPEKPFDPVFGNR